MSRIVLLDAGPLGMVTNPAGGPVNDQCVFWLRSLPSRGMRAAVSELADYEVRRELIRAGKTAGIRRLDTLKRDSLYIVISTDVMLRAAEYWASTRKQGKPTAPDDALDGDVILAAQAALLTEAGEDVVVATANVDHLARFVDARHWSEVT